MQNMAQHGTNTRKTTQLPCIRSPLQQGTSAYQDVQEQATWKD